VVRALPLCALAAAGCSFNADHGGSAYRCGDQGQCPSGYSCYDGVCLTEPPPDAAPPESWWDAAWHARRPLTVHNASAETLAAGHQLVWRVNLADDLGESSDDAVRLVAHDTETDRWSEIPRVVDDVISEQVVWFPLPVSLDPGEDEVVWVYQDNPAPPSAPWTGSDIFELADGFGEISPDRWVTAGAVVAEPDVIRFDETGQMRSAEPWPDGHALDIVARASDTASRFWFGFQRELPDFDPDVPWLLWIRRDPGDSMLPEYAGPGDTLETRWAGAPVAVGTGLHVYSVERMIDRVVYRFDYDVAHDDHDHLLDADHSAPLYIRFSNTSSSSFWVSRVRVRRVAYPPPELTLGARDEL
jgi:hypothetical protein